MEEPWQPLALFSALAVPLCCAGLLLLRMSRPGSLEGGNQCCFGIIGGLGCLLVFFGLIIQSSPALLGLPYDGAEPVLHKELGLILCSQVMLCWVAERCLLHWAGRGPPPCQSWACATIWTSSCLVTWAGPRPLERMSTILGSQEASCDAGYRTNFLLYMPLWGTGLIFGALLLCVPEQPLRNTFEHWGGLLLPTSPPSSPSARMGSEGGSAVNEVRRKMLPIVYGLSTSGSALALAIGWERNDPSHLTIGFALVALAAVCAFTWLWRMDLPLATWAALSQGWATLLRIMQEHLLFRDFQWDATRTHWLSMTKIPGIQLFLLGIAMMVLVLWFYDVTSNWIAAWDNLNYTDGRRGLPAGSKFDGEVPPEDDDDIVSHARRPLADSVWWQWVMFFACAGCLFVGISQPLVQTKIIQPQVEWLDGDEAIQRFRNTSHPWHETIWGHSYCDLLTVHYDNKMPMSALAAAYTSVLMPMLLFASLLLVLSRPPFMSDDVIVTIRHWIVHKAPYRFVTPMVLMMTVALVNLSDPGGATFQATFTQGIWYYMAYCFLVNVLACSVEGSGHRPPGDLRVAPSSSRSTSGSLQGHTVSSRRSKSDMATIDSQESPDIENVDGYCSEENEVDEKNSLGSVRGQNSVAQRQRKSASVDLMDQETELGESIGEYELDDDEEQSEGSSASADDGKDNCGVWLGIPAGIALFLLVPATLYFGLVEPLILFEMRFSHVVVLKSKPTILDMWQSLAKVSPPMAAFAAATLVFTLPPWIVLSALRHLQGVTDAKDRLCSRVCVVRFLERGVRPFVQGHIWVFSIAILYYIVTSRNRDMQEVCVNRHDTPKSLLALLLFGGIMLYVMGKSGKITEESREGKRHEGMPLSSLPGGSFVWGACPAAMSAAIFGFLYLSGPAPPRGDMGIQFVNRVLSENFLPAANRRISDYIPESKGDCEALWKHRVETNQVSPESLLQVKHGNRTAIYEHCVGHSPLTHMQNRNMDAMAVWATGLNTLHIKGINVSRPQRTSADTQVWKMYVSGMFFDVNVWLKVMLAQWHDGPWLDDYMCCDKNFNFTVEVSMPCTEGQGFERARLRFLHIDNPELHHSSCQSDTQDGSWCMEWVYPSAYEMDPNIHAALDDFLTGKKGSLLMKTSDGTVTDVLGYISHKLTEVVQLNTGNHCPQNL